MELPGLEDGSAVAVYADQLEERGDPRAQLVRAQLYGRKAQSKELIEAHWASWLGALSPAESLLKWESGFVIDAVLRKLPTDWRRGEFLERPALRLLRRLAFGPGAGRIPAGIDRARSLRELVCFTDPSALADVHLDRLQTLTLDLGAHDARVLATVQLPRLRQLHTRCAAAQEEGLLRALAAVRWWPSLTTWTHRVQSLPGLLALRACGPLVERGGRGLVALCEAPVLAQLPPDLRRTLPHAEFKLMPVPERPHDPDDSHGPAEVSVTPVEGRMDFRELSGWVKQSERSTQNSHGTDTTADGPGEPFTPGRDFTSCGWCGSGETRCIHRTSSSLYSHFETTSYERWEYECLECGLFTKMRSVRTR